MRPCRRWGKPRRIWRESFSPVVERRHSDLFVEAELRDGQARMSTQFKAVRPLLGLRMITRHVRNSKVTRIAAPLVVGTNNTPQRPTAQPIKLLVVMDAYYIPHVRVRGEEED
jgi:hypothetical protein